jgi:hypothetical protein
MLRADRRRNTPQLLRHIKTARRGIFTSGFTVSGIAVERLLGYKSRVAVNVTL